MADMVFLTRLKPEPMGAYNASTAYSVNSLVMSGDGAAAYLSVKDVPAGTPLSDENYWKAHTDLSAVKQSVEAAGDKALEAAEEALGTKKDLLEVIRNLTNPVERSGNPVQAELVGGIPFDEVTTTLEPKQEGSGDPYPAGGGKNLLSEVVAGTKTTNGITLTSNGDGSYRVSGTATGGANISFSLKSSVVIPSGAYWHLLNKGVTTHAAFVPKYSDGSNGSLAFSVENRIHAVSESLEVGKTCTELGVYVQSGATLDVTFKPMLLVDDVLSEFTPYSNIRPISGYDSLNLTRCGKNLLSNNATTQTVNGVTFTVNADGSVNVSGTSTVDYVTLELDADLRLVSGEYRLSQPYNGISCVINRYVRSTHAYSKFITSAGNVFSTIDWDYETYVYRVQLQIAASGTSVNGTAYPMIRLSSDTDATYEPYQGENFIANFGQTVYGGKVDWNKDELTVEWAITTLNGTEGFYVTAGSGEFKNFCITIPEKIAAPHGLVCSHYRYTTDSATWSGNTGISELPGETSKMVRIFDLNYSTGDIDGFKSYLAAQYAAGTPVQIAYKLATPTTIQLTPQEIAQLEGINTLHGDGKNAITGRQRPDLALISRIEALESAILNT